MKYTVPKKWEKLHLKHGNLKTLLGYHRVIHKHWRHVVSFFVLATIVTSVPPVTLVDYQLENLSRNQKQWKTAV